MDCRIAKPSYCPPACMERIHPQTAPSSLLTPGNDVLTVSASHLRQDLALAHDQGVQATGHAHQMVGSIAVAQQEQVGTQLLKGDAGGAAEPVLNLQASARGSESGPASVAMGSRLAPPAWCHDTPGPPRPAPNTFPCC